MKYSAALGQLPAAKAPFTPQDLKDAAELADDESAVAQGVAKAALGVIHFETKKSASQHAMSYLSGGLQKIVGRGWLWDKGFTASEHADKMAEKWSSEEYFANGYKPAVASSHAAQTQKRPFMDAATGFMRKLFGLPPTPESQTETKTEDSKGEAKDPMDAKLAQQREELALNQQERNQRMLDSSRSLMTIGDRRASILGEMPGLKSQIDERTGKMKGEGFLTDAQKDELNGITGKAREYSVNALRQKYEDETDKLQERYNKEKGDLKEKPMNFNADSMAKVGLYQASSVAFNPLTAKTDKTNQLLSSIDKKLSPRPGQTPSQRDPFSP